VCITKTREKEREKESAPVTFLFFEIEKIARAFLNNGARSVLSGRANKNDNTNRACEFYAADAINKIKKFAAPPQKSRFFKREEDKAS
jgi:hypothetical protein